MTTPLERLLAARNKAAAPAAPSDAAASAAAPSPAPVQAVPAPNAAGITPAPQSAPQAVPAPAAMAAPAAMPAPVVTPVITPAPTAQAPIVTDAPRPTTEVSVPSATSKIPVHIRTEAEAQNALTAMFGPQALNSSRSLADVADVDGSGMRLASPFAQIRKGNWSVHKSCPDAIKEFMPVGGEGMPFYCVYIAHRAAVTIWQGDPTDGNPPVGAYVVPSPRTAGSPEEAELADHILRETMKTASKIQFTKGIDRDRLFPEGKLTPETHVLVWTPNTGFILLVAPGYASTQDTLANFKGDIETKHALWPLCMSLKKHEVINKNANPGDKNYKWEHFSIEAKIVANARVQAVADAWAAFKAENMPEIMNQAMVFLKGEDHSGMSVEEIVGLLAKYAQRIAALPARQRK